MEVSATVKVMHNNQCRACEKKDWWRFTSSYDEASSSDILFYKDQKGISACSVREEFMLAKHLLSCHSWTSLSFYMFLCILNYKFKRIQSVLLRHFVSPTRWFGALIGLVSRQNKPKTFSSRKLFFFSFKEHNQPWHYQNYTLYITIHYHTVPKSKISQKSNKLWGYHRLSVIGSLTPAKKWPSSRQHASINLTAIR